MEQLKILDNGTSVKTAILSRPTSQCAKVQLEDTQPLGNLCLRRSQCLVGGGDDPLAQRLVKLLVITKQLPPIEWFAFTAQAKCLDNADGIQEPPMASLGAGGADLGAPTSGRLAAIRRPY